MKYIKISLIISLVSLVSFLAYKLTNKNTNQTLNEKTKDMLSFTIDGVKSTSMPSKGSGYIAKSITCKNNSILSWDNDNWSIEIEKLSGEELCNIDFTKGTATYLVKINTDTTNSFDSTSKSTTENGTVTFYSKYDTTISGCSYTKVDNKITIDNVSGNVTCNVSIKNTIYNKLLMDNSTIKTRTDFENGYTETNTKTLFKAKENGTTVYYFAGDAKNNWVKFGGFYWRIIRTNKDGSVKLLYHDTSTTSQTSYLAKNVAFNTVSSDPVYGGYMYGTSGSPENNRLNTNSSNVKTIVDEWYLNNLKSYSEYLSTTAIYCNDREEPKGLYNTGSTEFEYAAWYRFSENKTPTYDCNNVKDAFSGENTEALLTCATEPGTICPIALMTADEAMYAGGRYLKTLASPYAWYYTNSDGESSTGELYWWLMTPTNWYQSQIDSLRIRGTNLPATIDDYRVHISANTGVRPVTSLKSCVKYSSGDGSASNPYTIEETSSGC